MSPAGASALGCAPGPNRRSKVMRVYSSLALLDVSFACAPALASTSQLLAVPGVRLDSKRHDCGCPSPLMVTVTFSHQGAEESSLSRVLVGVVAAAAIVAAEASARASVARNTCHSFVPHVRSAGTIAAAT